MWENKHPRTSWRDKIWTTKVVGHNIDGFIVAKNINESKQNKTAKANADIEWEQIFIFHYLGESHTYNHFEYDVFLWISPSIFQHYL